MSVGQSPLRILGFLALVCVVLGLFQGSIRRSLTGACVECRRWLDRGRERLEAMQRSLGMATSQALERLGLDGEDWNPSFVVGGIACTAVAAVLVACDAFVMELSLQALGLVKSSSPLPVGLQSVFLVSTILPAVYAAWFARELRGHSGLVPAHRYSAGWRVTYLVMAGSVVLLVLAVVVTLGLFRAEAVLSAPAVTGAAPSGGADCLGLVSTDGTTLDPTAIIAGLAPGPWERRATTVAMVAIPVELLLATVLAVEAGPALLLELLPAGAFFALRGPVWLADRLLGFSAASLEWFYGAGIECLEVTQRVGIVLSRPIVTVGRLIHQEAEASLTRIRALAGEGPAIRSGPDRRILRGLRWVVAGTAVAATAWALDVELPEEGIGDRERLDEPDIATAAGGERMQTQAIDEAATVPSKPSGDGHVASRNGGNPLDGRLELDFQPRGSHRGWNPFSVNDRTPPEEKED